MKKLNKINPMRLKRGSQSGFSLAEVASSSILVLLALMVTLDTWFFINAAIINDSACHDAARAASQGSDSQTAGNLAASAVASYSGHGTTFIQSPQVANFTYQDYGGTIPSGSIPYVTVTTQCQVKPIIPFYFLSGMFIGSQNVTFSQTYTFPIVKTKSLSS